MRLLSIDDFFVLDGDGACRFTVVPQMAEPSDASAYAKREYWDSRYAIEEQYDWFGSVYGESLKFTIDTIREFRNADPTQPTRVLHVGTGNSQLVADLHAAFARDPTIRLQQVAVDYSSVVVDNMRRRYTALTDVEWAVGDVRHLSLMPSCQSPFHVIIDKGTMDALQADKANPALDEDLTSMLRGVSSSLVEGGAFVQFTWETPYYRLFITKQAEFGWVNEQLVAKPLPGSDMYYYFRYIKRSPSYHNSQ